jgi:DNA-binding GntR family transcriptional regulator
MSQPLSSDALPPPAASLTQAVADLLRERILAGDFQPGERLNEAEIARQLETSRGPIREALAQLRAEGLVFERPRRGTFVAVLTEDDVREIYELRGALESQAARLIVERDDRAALAALRAIVDGMARAADANDRDAFARLDSDLHLQICRLSGNGRLLRAFVQHAGLLSSLLRLEITTQYETLDEILGEHLVLMDELESGDPERAARGCDAHLRSALERVTEMRR